MEVRHLRYFLALAAKRNFTRAAEQVHVSQPTLSQQIKELENELGKPLFVRGRRPTDLTEAGQIFSIYARRALEALDTGIRAISGAPEQLDGALSIGAVHGLMREFVPRLAVDFAARFRRARLRLEELRPAEICAGVASGALDLGLCYDARPAPDYELIPLATDTLHLIVPPDHPFASLKFVRMAQLDGARLIMPRSGTLARRALDHALESAGARPIVVMETNSISATSHILKRLPVAATTSRVMTAEFADFVMLPLEGPSITMTIYIVARRETVEAPLVAAFMAALRRVDPFAVNKQARVER